MSENESSERLAYASVHVQAGPELVWRALTEPALVTEYFFGTTVSTDWKPGSPISYTGEWNGQAYEDKGVVIEADAPRRLVTSFFSPMSGLPDAPENHQIVSYQIDAVSGGSRVTVTQDNNPSAEAAQQSSGNWRSILDGLAAVAERLAQAEHA